MDTAAKKMPAQAQAREEMAATLPRNELSYESSAQDRLD
jgi:hypothetical protein